jgi:hypothetical protein
VREADLLQQRERALTARGARDAGPNQRQLDVRHGREVREQVVVLEDEADDLPVVARAVAVARDLDAVDGHSPARRLVERADQRQQRRLARARWPGERHELPGLDRQRDVGHRDDRSRVHPGHGVGDDAGALLVSDGP